MVKKYAFLVDLRKCIGCTSCQVSCKMENSTPMGSFRSKVSIADVGRFPHAKRFFFPKMCNHCDKPPCLDSCPVEGATFKRKDGVVVVNRDKCIGCARCIDDCPYGARFIHSNIQVKNDPKKYAQEVAEVRGKNKSALRVVDKCDFCLHRLDAGIEQPACVRNCVGKARFFGNISDQKSQISKLISTHRTAVWNPDLETEPTVYFIAPDNDVFDEAAGEINE